MSHPEGWTLMLGMPSAAVLTAIQGLPDADAQMESAVAAEVRRFHRAVGMSTWEVIMAHNRQVGSVAQPTMEDFLEAPPWVEEQDLFKESGYVPKERWRPGGKPLVGAKLRQASIAAWALLPEDAQVLLDALEYAEDVSTAAVAAFDLSLLVSHAATPRVAPCVRPQATTPG